MSSVPPATERRRRDDRRRADRRRDEPEFSATLTEESLFDAMGSGLEGAPPTDAPDSRGERSDHPDWSATSLPADSPYLARQARRIVGAGESGFERMYRIFVGARAALGLALLGAQIVGLLVGTRSLTGGLISLAYAVQALTLWILPRFRHRAAGAPAPTRMSRRQWAATIGVDLLAFSALHLLAPSATFNYTPLLVLPALMAGVLTPRLPAVATAAAASLILLASAWQASLSGADPTSALLPAGLTGIGLFVITLLAGELAARLARE
jgi:two-component system sensor histidine kinase PilS (NtrC family)